MTDSKTINTLSEFLLQAQTQYLIFDMGRGIRKIEQQTFFEWENQQAPCAYPRQDHAWFCVAFWNENASQDKYIWFAKLPVDESGLMIQASRNQFLEIITTALGSQLEHTENEQAQLPENPYIFVPNQQQLADCNAHITKELANNSSLSKRDNTLVNSYMQAPSVQQWESLSVQDIADFVCDSVESENCKIQATLAQNMQQFPQAVLTCVFSSLENIWVNATLAEAIIAVHRATQVKLLKPLCLRALSFSEPVTADKAKGAHNLGAEYIVHLIRSDDPLDIETCVVIAGRFWTLFQDHELLLSYMHKTAVLDASFELFVAMYSDLVKVPECRNHMLSLLRNSQRTELVSQAIGKLFSR